VVGLEPGLTVSCYAQYLYLSLSESPAILKDKFTTAIGLSLSLLNLLDGKKSTNPAKQNF
jgi:hypothetical protein